MLQQSTLSGNSTPALSWFAGIGLFCLLPILFLMLFLDEDQFALWLPLIALIKALGIPGCIFLIIKTAPEALAFGSVQNSALLPAVFSASFFILGDTLTAVYCFWRSRKLCK